MRILQARCEYREAPFISEGWPRLTWRLESERRGARQTAWQVRVGSREGEGDLWDSGRVESPEPSAIYDGRALRSRERCFWQVRVWDQEGGASVWSDAARWEMGLLEEADWRAEWIGMEKVRRGDAAVLFRREFRVTAPVRRARLYVCGLGWHEARINGEKVGDAVLEPAQTDYPARCFYVAHDVTDLVSEGANAVGIEVADGWYNQNRGLNNGKGFPYGEPRLLAQLEVECEDGELVVVATDTAWRAATGPVTRANVYGGESHDARLERDGWDGAGYDDGDWGDAIAMDAPGGVLACQPMAPMRRVREVALRDAWETRPGMWVLDFGENIAGWVRLRLKDVPRGTTVRMRFAETLNGDGEFDPASTGIFATRVAQVDKYVCRGGAEEVWEPRFTYHGFRYVEATGFAEKPTAETVVAVVVHSDLPRTGEFACSDAMLTRLHDMAVRTHLANAHGTPEDCPARERCGWTGDAIFVSEYSLRNLDSVAFWRKYLDDMETRREGGLPYDIAPGLRMGRRGCPDWVRAMIQLPWTLYLHTGDVQILERHWEAMRLVIEHFGERAEGWILTGGRGDWCDPEHDTRPTYTPEALTTTAWFVLDARTMAMVAERLGHGDDARRYGEWAEVIRRAFVERFYDAEAGSFGSQTADAIALELDLVPEEKREAVADALVRDIVETRGLHWTVGIMGMRHLGGALARSGHGDVALRLFNQTTAPSYGDLIARGATTLWEYWGEPAIDAWDGPRSLSHPMFGGFDTWFFEGIAGIRPDPAAPGYAHFVVEPQMLEGLEWARGRMATERGEVAAEWRRERGGATRLSVSVPVGSNCTVRLSGVDAESVREGDGEVGEALGVEGVARDGDVLAIRIASGEYAFAWQE